MAVIVVCSFWSMLTTYPGMQKLHSHRFVIVFGWCGLVKFLCWAFWIIIFSAVVTRWNSFLNILILLRWKCLKWFRWHCNMDFLLFFPCCYCQFWVCSAKCHFQKSRWGLGTMQFAFFVYEVQNCCADLITVKNLLPGIIELQMARLRGKCHDHSVTSATQ